MLLLKILSTPWHTQPMSNGVGGLLDTRCWIRRLILVAARRSSIAQDRHQYYYYYYYCATRELEKNEHTHMCRTTHHMPCPHQWRTIDPDRAPPRQIFIEFGCQSYMKIFNPFANTTAWKLGIGTSVERFSVFLLESLQCQFLSYYYYFLKEPLGKVLDFFKKNSKPQVKVNVFFFSNVGVLWY